MAVSWRIDIGLRKRNKFIFSNPSHYLDILFSAAGSGQSVNDTSVNDQKYGKRIIVIIPHMPFLLGFIEQRCMYSFIKRFVQNIIDTIFIRSLLR